LTAGRHWTAAIQVPFGQRQRELAVLELRL
jgi:hypothetical protein